MTRFAAVLLLLAASVVHANPDYITTVSGTTTSASNGTALHTGLVRGVEYLIQCTNASVRYRTCESSSCTATTDDTLLPKGAMIPVPMPEKRAYFAFLAEAAEGYTSFACKIYRAASPFLK